MIFHKNMQQEFVGLAGLQGEDIFIFGKTRDNMIKCGSMLDFYLANPAIKSAN
jgi:hypothetical protein